MSVEENKAVVNLCERFVASPVERVMGFEPTTSCLGSRHSAAELHPLRSYPF